MNLGQMRTELQFILTVQDSTADQDFSTTRLNKALQYAYEDEIRQAKLEGQMRWFRANLTITWPVSQVTMPLPLTMQSAGIISILDTTNSNPGIKLTVRETGTDGGDLFWVNNTTLQWGSSGPSETKTIQFDFLAMPETILINDNCTPQLMPVDYHWLIIWSAGIFLRDVADEGAPNRWIQKQSELRHDYWKFLSRGRPFSDVATVNYNGAAASSFSEVPITSGPGGGLEP